MIRWPIVAALLLAPALARAQAPAAGPIPVGVIPVAREAVSEATAFIGRIEAVERVEVRARITGFLEERTFREGQEVKKGDALFLLERGPNEAALASAKASEASAMANQVNADVQLRRADELVRTNNIPVSTRDQRRAEAQTAAARVLEAQASVRTAEINLGYTIITAPVAGRIGRAALTQGNVVGPDTGVLALLVSQDPMFVTFPVSQRLMLEIDQRRRERGLTAVRVKLRFSNGATYPHDGEIEFVDVTVAQGTDTISVRARVPNPDRVLVDGQFVSVSVEEVAPEQRVVIPQSATLLDQQGTYVFVVEDNKATVKRLRTGQVIGARVVVSEGLAGGEMLIVDGLQRIRPGAPVQATPQAPRATRSGT